MAAKLKTRNYRRGEVIFHQDDPGSDLHIIKSGQVKIATSSPEGEEIIMALLTAGDSFGEIALLDGKPRSAGAIAMEATQTLTLNREDFLIILIANADMARAILASVAAGWRKTSHLLEDAMFLDLPARLAKRLLELAEKHGTMTAGGIEIDLQLTQQDLAAAVGVSRVAMNRQLGLLQKGLPVTGEAPIDAQHEALREMVARLILVDRVVPQPTVLVTALLIIIVAEPVLMLARDRRRAIAAIAVLGLSPLFVERVGELAMTYLLPAASYATPGGAITLPHRFVTGPLILWRGADSAPHWLELLDARLNLISLASVALWSVGLHQHDGRRWELWHVALPAACLAGAGAITWALTPVVMPILMQ